KLELIGNQQVISDRNVELGTQQPLQQLLMVGDRLNDARLRIGQGEGMRKFRHHHGRERDETAQRQLPADTFSDFAGNRIDVLGLLDQPLRLDQQEPPSRSQRKPLRMAADEKLGSEFLLQMRDRRRDRRLRYVDSLGRQSDASSLGRRNEIFDLA